MPVYVGTDLQNPIVSSAGTNLETYHPEQVGGFPGGADSYNHFTGVGGSRTRRQRQKQKKQQQKQKTKKRVRPTRRRRGRGRGRGRLPDPKHRKSRKHARRGFMQIGRGGAVYGFQGADLAELNAGSQGATYAPISAIGTNQNTSTF